MWTCKMKRAESATLDASDSLPCAIEIDVPFGTETEVSAQNHPALVCACGPDSPAQKPAVTTAGACFEFEGFRFDSERGLSRDGRAERLAQKELRGLELLLSRRGTIVSRDEYIQAAWRGGVVSDDSVARSIYLLRRALARSQGRAIVETVYGCGYRITVPIRVVSCPAVAPGAREAKRPALETFRVGMALLGRHRASDFDAALPAFRYAAQLDPSHASAWAAVAHCHVAKAMLGSLGARQAGSLALEAVERALAIDPDAAGALAARGWVRGAIQQRLHDGFSDLDRAVALDPCSWLARCYRAWLLPALGEYDAALDEIEVAHELTPLHPTPRALRGWLLFCAGRVDEAIASLRTAGRETGDWSESLLALSISLAFAGYAEEAMATARKAGEADPLSLNPLASAALAYALARTGDRPGALGIVNGWDARRGACPPMTHVAAVHFALGDSSRAAIALARARMELCPYLVFAGGDPRLASLQTDASAASSDSSAPPRATSAPVATECRSIGRQTGRAVHSK
jgi:DNA-binding winged helix-turn-helix (wHTH) protein/Flp pilus assembly protein TadD